MKQYYKFTEHNDHEGETWHFFVPMKKEQRDKIEAILSTIKYDNPYELSEVTFDEQEVDVLVKHSTSGYMSTYNKIKKEVFTLPDSVDFEEEDPFYKGQFWD